MYMFMYVHTYIVIYTTAERYHADILVRVKMYIGLPGPLKCTKQ